MIFLSQSVRAQANQNPRGTVLLFFPSLLEFEPSTCWRSFKEPVKVDDKIGPHPFLFPSNPIHFHPYGPFSINAPFTSFSRYTRVLENDGTTMGVRTALTLINGTLDEVLAEQEGEFDGETRRALAWFDQDGFAEGPYGVAETLSTAKNTAVDAMAEAGILIAKAGKVRLLRTDETTPSWDPNTDKRFTIWEATSPIACARCSRRGRCRGPHRPARRCPGRALPRPKLPPLHSLRTP